MDGVEGRITSYQSRSHRVAGCVKSKKTCFDLRLGRPFQVFVIDVRLNNHVDQDARGILWGVMTGKNN